MGIMEKNTLKEILKEKGITDTKGLQSFLGEMTKEVIELLYEEEMHAHLGYEKHSSKEKESENRRNGYTSKKVNSKVGAIELNTPRDRDGAFEPEIVKKRQRDITGMEDKVVSLYALGTSTRDIRAHIHEWYGYEMSPETVSRITDSVVLLAKEWQQGPLKDIYSIVFIDAMVIKMRKDRVVQKATVYGLIGIDLDGNKECLGLYITQDAESSKYWGAVLIELRNRGVKDILICCVDNLSGISQAIEKEYPNTEIQKCIVHQIRNSLKHVGWKKRKEVAADLKPIYQAVTEQAGMSALEAFEEKWGKKFPYIAQSWRNNWSELSTFFKYKADLRRLIYTTNPIESFNQNMRKISKNRPVFEHEEAALKLFYLGVLNLEKRWTMKVREWGEIYSQLLIYFKERIAKYIS